MQKFPIFLFNGLLESGKTTLIKKIIENEDSFQHGHTLIVATERGEIEYDDSWLKKNEVKVVYVETQGQLSPRYLSSLQQKYQPQFMFIEYNGFFDLDKQEMPSYMEVQQQITLIDASSFGVMFPNMKSIFNQMVKYTSLVLFNRCDNYLSELSSYRRLLRAFSKSCQVGFETTDGKITDTLDEDLPYDISKDTILIEEEAYPFFCMDVYDNFSRYEGKTVRFKAFVRKVISKDFIIGRDVMTCCENDIQFLGFYVENLAGKEVKEHDSVFVEGEIKKLNSHQDDLEYALVAKKISILEKEEDKVLTF